MSDLTTVAFAGTTFQIRRDPARPSFFLFGVRKSGSSIMNAMVSALAGFNDVNYVDVAGRLFDAGVRVAVWQPDAEMSVLLDGGNLYGGFRNAPLGIAGHPYVAASRSVLMVRDPRDALVSEYFSNAHSHSVPAEGEARDYLLAEREKALRASIAEYVMKRAPDLRRTLRQYHGFLDQPGLRLYRYEDAILQKRWFLQDVCEHWDWRVTDAQLGGILGWADVMPEEENPTAFVRKVVPGDHKDKLGADTIAQLDEYFAEELALFGYDEEA